MPNIKKYWWVYWSVIYLVVAIYRGFFTGMTHDEREVDLMFVQMIWIGPMLFVVLMNYLGGEKHLLFNRLRRELNAAKEFLQRD